MMCREREIVTTGADTLSRCEVNKLQRVVKLGVYRVDLGTEYLGALER